MQICYANLKNVFFNNELNPMCLGNPNKLIIAHLNINPLEYKLNLQEVKLIFSWSWKQKVTKASNWVNLKLMPLIGHFGLISIAAVAVLFCPKRYTRKTDRLRKTSNLYVVSTYVELNLRNQKRLISCSYYSNKPIISQHMESLRKNMALYSSTCESSTFLCEFDADVEHTTSKGFCNLYFLSRLINKSTCWKNASKVCYINFIATNSLKYF